MPVYLFTLHAYRSWMPDRPRGYVRKGKGILPPDRDMARRYAARAQGPPLSFDHSAQSAFLCAAHDACNHHSWRLHCVATDPTHLHILLSWSGFLDWKTARNRLKNSLSYLVNKAMNCAGRRWFALQGSRKRVTDMRHFNYLIEVYLHKHRGVYWREGDPLPQMDVTATQAALDSQER